MVPDKLETESPETQAELRTALSSCLIIAGVCGFAVWWFFDWSSFGFFGGLVVCFIAFVVFMAGQGETIAGNDRVRREQSMLAELKRANNPVEDASQTAQHNSQSIP